MMTGLLSFAHRIKVLLEHYRNLSLPTEGELWIQYHRWYNAIFESSAFRATATDHPGYRDRLVAFYLPYSVGGGQSDVTSLRSVG